jgi:hypothetical protein
MEEVIFSNHQKSARMRGESITIPLEQQRREASFRRVSL